MSTLSWYVLWNRCSLLGRYSPSDLW